MYLCAPQLLEEMAPTLRTHLVATLTGLREELRREMQEIKALIKEQQP